MISDGNSSLWSGDFVRVGDERTSPTSYARTFECAGLTESVWALKWDLVMLTFLSVSSNNNFSTNSTALNRNSTAATSTIALAQHHCSRQELVYFITSVNSFHPALKYTWVVPNVLLLF